MHRFPHGHDGDIYLLDKPLEMKGNSKCTLEQEASGNRDKKIFSTKRMFTILTPSLPPPDMLD